MASHDKGSDKSIYRATERRKSARRFVVDRRKDIRWEPDNPNRRLSTGRRAIDQLGVFHPKR